MKRQQGIALLLVLWLLALLSVLLAALAATVQLQHRQSAWLSGHTQALLAAEAGLSLAVMALQAREPRERWAADGQPHRAELGRAELWVRVRSERGKLDLNAASAADVRRLLLACGADAAVSTDVSQALEQRRNGPAALRTLEELGQLPGMTYALYRCVQGLVTVWSGAEQPDPSLAPARLARALGLPVVHVGDAQPGQIFTIVSTARLADGQRATLHTTLMLNPAKEGARPYRVLRWQE